VTIDAIGSTAGPGLPAERHHEWSIRRSLVTALAQQVFGTARPADAREAGVAIESTRARAHADLAGTSSISTNRASPASRNVDAAHGGRRMRPSVATPLATSPSQKESLAMCSAA
jgi:hypothetical protein